MSGSRVGARGAVARAAVVLAAGAVAAGGSGLGPSAARAQGVEPPPVALPTPPAAAGAPPTIYLMTFGRGDAVWERYAHNAVRVVDPADGTDLSYNWGEFDFDQPNFIGRFLTGDTKYSMRAFPSGLLAEAYARRFNRAVYLQELAVAPAAARALADSLRAFDTEERRYYRYDVVVGTPPSARSSVPPSAWSIASRTRVEQLSR